MTLSVKCYFTLRQQTHSATCSVELLRCVMQLKPFSRPFMQNIELILLSQCTYESFMPLFSSQSGIFPECCELTCKNYHNFTDCMLSLCINLMVLFTSAPFTSRTMPCDITKLCTVSPIDINSLEFRHAFLKDKLL